MSQISKCPKLRVVLGYWEALGEVSELRYKNLLYSSSKRSYCINRLFIATKSDFPKDEFWQAAVRGLFYKICLKKGQFGIFLLVFCKSPACSLVDRVPAWFWKSQALPPIHFHRKVGRGTWLVPLWQLSGIPTERVEHALPYKYIGRCFRALGGQNWPKCCQNIK